MSIKDELHRRLRARVRSALQHGFRDFEPFVSVPEDLRPARKSRRDPKFRRKLRRRLKKKHTPHLRGDRASKLEATLYE